MLNPTRSRLVAASVVAIALLAQGAPAQAVLTLTTDPVYVNGVLYRPDRVEVEDFRFTVTIVDVIVFSFDDFFNYDFDQDTPGLQGRLDTGSDFSGFEDLSEPLNLIDFGVYGEFTPYALVPDRVEVTFNTASYEIVSQAAVTGSTSAPLGVSFFGVDSDGSPLTVDYVFSFTDSPDGYFIYDSAFNQDGSPSGFARIDSILTYGSEGTITSIETIVSDIPEPASAAMLAIGAAAMARRRRIRSNQEERTR